jgi:hypothetical protein
MPTRADPVGVTDRDELDAWFEPVLAEQIVP